MAEQSISVDAESLIRQRIIEGVVPAGSWLRESALAEDLGVSRTPVREACIRLARDGLLEWTPKRGFRSQSLDEAELDAVYPVLVALEILAIGSIAEPLEDVVSGLRAAELSLGSSANSSDLYEIDRSWHSRIVAATQNPILIQMHGRLVERLSRYVYAYWRGRTDIHKSASDHTQIIEALERGDFDLAAAWVRSHRRHGLERIRRLMNHPAL